MPVYRCSTVMNKGYHLSQFDIGFLFFRWNNRVHILHCDMRNLAELKMQRKIPNADIIISELLGSFADNELCPECLDGVSMIVDDNTVFIPKSYKSYLGNTEYFYSFDKKSFQHQHNPSVYIKI